MNQPELLIFGCGNMGAAIAAGLLARNPAARIVAIDPDTKRALALLPEGANVTVWPDLLRGAALKPALSLMAVKPQLLTEALASFSGTAAAQGLVASVVAGVSAATFRRLLPSARIVRTMPNTPALVGAGVTALWADDRVTAQDRACCEQVFGAVGDTYWLEREEHLHAVTAVSGSGPAYVFAMVSALERAAVTVGLPDALAQDLARSTFAGAMAMLADRSSDPERLKAAVRSPQGTTDAALKIFEADEFLDVLLRRAVEAAHSRSVELGRGLT